MPRPVVLCVLDGWGHRDDPVENAIVGAKTPVYDQMIATCPNTFLAASGVDVGLPDGQMGNSEVGHLNLGAGRIVSQEIRRIDSAVSDGSLLKNPEFVDFVRRLKQSGGACHLVGMVSPGGVHSHQDHIAALVRGLDAAGVPILLHAILDGRDMPPASGLDCMTRLLSDTAGLERFRVATVTGRYYAMDRDNRWERTRQAYDCMVSATGKSAAEPIGAIRASYDADLTDEFMLPTAIGDYAGMGDADGVLVANFRADRIRQTLLALLDPEFEAFRRGDTVSFTAALGMVEYSVQLSRFHSILFAPVRLGNILGEIISEAGLRQLRIAETEKYAHVTFFFNGGVETPFAGEERILVPSPKVATYDLQPEMSAAEVTDKLVAAIGAKNFDFILVNFANPDMVGHTGILAAAITAIETVDFCLGRLEKAVLDAGGTMLITADHGNAEVMFDAETGDRHTAHTLNLVPAILVNPPANARTLADGNLADVAPTVLALLGLPQPEEMTGRSLLQQSQNVESDVRARAPA